jgi:hypothetical protein
MIATKIKRIILADLGLVTADIDTAAKAKALIDAAIAAVPATAEDVSNVHQDTWQITESEASVESYRNDIANSIYRREVTPGELTIQFTMGEYSEKMKAALRGGQVVTKGGDGADKDTVIGYKGDAAATEIEKTALCLTQDGYWFIYPKVRIAANTAETDKAAALAVKGYPIKPDEGIFTEYNFNSALLG